MEEYKHLAIWPMDVESLVDTSIYEGGITPAHNIFRKALDRSLWLDINNCPAGKLCPFHTNLELLSDRNTLDNLIKILRKYEISSGKRLTFRELFSLVSQLLVGHESDFISRDKIIDPCDWAGNHADTINSDANDNFDKTKARYYLSSKIYCHSLFPRWPNLRKIKNKCEKILEKNPLNEANANDLFRLLGWFKREESTSISKLIRDQFGVLLDPVEVSGDVILADDNISSDNLEEMFCYSIDQGYTAIKKFMSEPERAMMEWLVRVEKHIGKDASRGNKNFIGLYDEVYQHIRLFACRLVKRSLAVKNGITKENRYLEYYNKTIEDEVELKKVRKQFSDLIHENSRFPVSLSTTYGQLVPHPDHDAVLYTNPVKVSYIKPTISDMRARSSMPYLKIKDYAVPLTYNLFKSLFQIREGLMKASVPTDTLALIEGTRARMAGDLVRDNYSLEDSTLSVGNKRYELTLFNGHVKVVEE